MLLDEVGHDAVDAHDRQDQCRAREYADQHCEVPWRRQRLRYQLVARRHVRQCKTGIERSHRLAQGRHQGHWRSLRAKHEETAWQIDERKINRSVLSRRVEPDPLDIADNAHDRRPGTRRASAIVKAAAHDLLAGEEPVRPRAIDDDGIFLEGVLIEQSATFEPKANRREEPGRNAHPGADRLVLAVRRRAILEIEVVLLPALAGRPAVGDSGRFDAR